VSAIYDRLGQQSLSDRSDAGAPYVARCLYCAWKTDPLSTRDAAVAASRMHRLERSLDE
jgi:hypothetical protein